MENKINNTEININIKNFNNFIPGQIRYVWIELEDKKYKGKTVEPGDIIKLDDGTEIESTKLVYKGWELRPILIVAKNAINFNYFQISHSIITKDEYIPIPIIDPAASGSNLFIEKNPRIYEKGLKPYPYTNIAARRFERNAEGEIKIEENKDWEAPGWSHFIYYYQKDNRTATFIKAYLDSYNPYYKDILNGIDFTTRQNLAWFIADKLLLSYKSEELKAYILLYMLKKEKIYPDNSSIYNDMFFDVFCHKLIDSDVINKINGFDEFKQYFKTFTDKIIENNMKIDRYYFKWASILYEINDFNFYENFKYFYDLILKNSEKVQPYDKNADILTVKSIFKKFISFFRDSDNYAIITNPIITDDSNNGINILDIFKERLTGDTIAKDENRFESFITYINLFYPGSNLEEIVKASLIESKNKLHRTSLLKIYEDFENEHIIKEIDKYFDDIYKLRNDSLAEEGEFGIGNLVFKEIRRRGYLDDLKEIRAEEKSKELSLEN